ncbi:protein DpdG [Nocardia wallacei]|uniref:protein DpdG n=1 Tax=Nocardia wallacei TaxID=480035 RepID=UPI002457AA3C|nr:protein DpdG [Nocardia wallacei]
MTALINAPAPVPRYIWAATRHLLMARGKRQREAVARALLSPPSLFTGGEDTRDTFGMVVQIGTELGVFIQDGEDLALADEARALDPMDPRLFFDFLRNRVLARLTATELVTDASLTRGKDLVRALCWFLTQPCDVAVDSSTFEGKQQDALPEGLRNPLTNPSRWNYFVYWAPALGFAANDLLQVDGAVALVPDCSIAVRRTIRSSWSQGTTVAARTVVDELLRALPVLPGGEFSRAMALDSGPVEVSPVLSWALLDAHDRGTLRLTKRSDATDVVRLVDPEGPGGIRSVALIEIGDTNL